MNISASQSGYNLIQQSNQMVNKAASDINQQINQRPVEDTRLDNQASSTDQTQDAERSTSTQTDALINLQQASQYSRIGTNIVQREQELIGTLLDTRV